MSAMLAGIEREARQRGITRLCHFTPSRNLIHITSGKLGVLATKHLWADERAVYTPTDLQRLDRHEGYVCCSIQYPNAWYLDRARDGNSLFPDWVVLLIHPKYLWRVGTRFCPRNAAASFGRLIAEGEDAFCGLFAPAVSGAYGRSRQRSTKHLLCSPTDDQAEVLIPDRVPLEDVLGVVVADEAQAKREAVRLHYAGVDGDTFTFVVAPVFFDRYALSTVIRAGQQPPERVWAPGATNHDE